MGESNPIIEAVQRQIAGCEQFFYDAWVSQQVNGISGDYAEFGSWGANTFRASYAGMTRAGLERHLWAFDSWQGLPQTDDPRTVTPDGDRAVRAARVARKRSTRPAPVTASHGHLHGHQRLLRRDLAVRSARTARETSQWRTSTATSTPAP